MTRGNDGHLKYLLWLTVERTSCVFYRSITYCHGRSTLKQVKGSETGFTNTMYNFSLFFSFKVFNRHCTSVIPRTPIYRAFTNSYVQIYLVKPWLISTVFKPTYLKIKHFSKYLIALKRNLKPAFFDPKTRSVTPRCSISLLSTQKYCSFHQLNTLQLILLSHH